MVGTSQGIFAFSATSIGASHLKIGKPCQDYSAHLIAGKTAIAAVADGHGGESYFRSDRGAQFAVETALKCIEEFITFKNHPLHDPCSLLSTLEKSIIAGWHEKIAEDVKNYPTDTDIFASDDDICSQYGTTLIAAAITEHYWFAIQIGDGKCVIIDKDNKVSQPVPWDERCFLNITTSLCDADASKLFRHYYNETPPLAVFIESDGIDDSFPVNENEKHLARFYLSVYDNFAKEGLKEGEAQLREMLPMFSKKGSGDDVSIGGIIRGIKE